MGRKAIYTVTLTLEERRQLKDISRNGRGSAKKVLYGRALLLLDTGEFAEELWTMKDTATALGLSTRTLEHLKKRFVMEGLDAALERRKPCRPSRRIIFDGEFEAHLTRLACSQAPDGRSRWTVRLLRDKLIELKIVPTISVMTVHNTLKKKKLNLI